MKCFIKRSVAVIGILLAAVWFCSGTCYGYDKDIYAQQEEIVGTDHIIQSVPAESRQLLNWDEPSVDLDLGEEVLSILQKTGSEGKTVFFSVIQVLMKIFIVVVICGFARGYADAMQSGYMENIIRIAGILAILSMTFGDFKSLLSMAITAIQDLNIFSKGMLPVMASAIAVSGAPTTSVVVSSVTMICFDFLVTAINSVFIPMVCAYLAIITANCALGNDMLLKLAGFIKWIITGALKLIMTVFISYLTVSGIIGGSVDSAVTKTAKFALSGAVPVVGGIISDATESLLSGAVILKNATGVFGLICVIAICVIPFIHIGINYLVFKGGTAVISPVCDNHLSKFISGIGDSLGMVLGMLGACSIVVFFELIFSIVVGGRG